MRVVQALFGEPHEKRPAPMVLRRLIPVAILVASFLPAVLAQVRDEPSVERLRPPLDAPRTEGVLRALPDATTQTCLVRPVDAETWKELCAAVGFQVELRELTSQAIYSIYSEQRPIGLVQVRSEEARWGIIELVWVYDLDLTVRDLIVRRCRDRNRATIEGDSFIEQLRGLDRRGLESLLGSDPTRIDAKKVLIHPAASQLAATIVRSGVKGLAVAEVLWRSQIAEWRLVRQAWNQFSTATDVQTVLAVLEDAGNDTAPSSAQKQPEVLAAWAYASDARVLGGVVLISMQVGAKGSHLTLWSLSPKNVVLDARPALPGDDGQELIGACSSLRGRRLEEISVSEEPARLAARQILAVNRRVESRHVR